MENLINDELGSTSFNQFEFDNGSEYETDNASDNDESDDQSAES